MKRIVYHIRSFPHRRVYEALEHRDDVEQIILAPKPQIIDNVLEDYSNFGIKDVRIFSDLKDAQKIADQLKPDVFAQTYFPDIINTPAGCKRVFMGHGMIGNHVMSMFKRGAIAKFKDFDLYCGVTDYFREWIWHITDKKPDVITNAMVQLDLLADQNYYMLHKARILSSTKKPHSAAVILFCGFCCKKRGDYNKHNEDYFATVVELEKIAKKNNWLIMVKPRQDFRNIMKYLGIVGGWTEKYRTLYPQVVKSPHLHFIGYENNVYRYFFADVVICNGCSTVEIESCVAEKPLIIVRTKTGAEYDPFGTVSSGAALEVKDISKIEGAVLKALQGGPNKIEQENLLKKIGITADGLAHKRVQDRLVLL